MKMKAAILEALQAPLVLGEVEVPALECGQVLVQIHSSGICGAQLGEIADRLAVYLEDDVARSERHLDARAGTRPPGDPSTTLGERSFDDLPFTHGLALLL